MENVKHTPSDEEQIQRINQLINEINLNVKLIYAILNKRIEDKPCFKEN